jgi:hypothetical protein
MGYAGGATPVNQFYTETSATVKNTTKAGAVAAGPTIYLKGVTINPSANTCHVKIYDGAANTDTLIYEMKIADEDMYQEYIAAVGIKAQNGLFVELVAGTNSVAVIWQ